MRLYVNHAAELRKRIFSNMGRRYIYCKLVLRALVQLYQAGCKHILHTRIQVAMCRIDTKHDSSSKVSFREESKNSQDFQLFVFTNTSSNVIFTSILLLVHVWKMNSVKLAMLEQCFRNNVTDTKCAAYAWFNQLDTSTSCRRVA